MNISIEKFCSMIQPQENKEYFDIPTIQRGFVWKPHQIEDLWDSLARNFPIGTFIIDDTTNNKQILDGQQRASAIAIGYNINSFNLNNDFRRLFVDIAKPNPETDKKFIFKLITRSHPWGYQLKDNEKILTVADRRNALEVFEEIIKDEKYYNVENKENFFPYDCCLPVPVELFLQQNLDSVKEWLIKNFGNYIIIENNTIKIRPIVFSDFYKFDDDNKFVRQLKVPTKGLLEIYENIFKQYKNEFKKKNPKQALNQEIEKKFDNDFCFYPLDYLHEKIQNIKSYQLVFSNLTNSELKFADNIIENDKKRIINEGEKTEDIEIIFQRLNRGGTPISEDDLTYSLFKSSFGESDEKRKILNSFNDNCKGLINPSRLFRLAYLLWEQKERYEDVTNKSKKYELVNQRIDYKLAKNNFNKDEFKNFLKTFQDNYFKNFTEIFLYDSNTNKIGLPYPLFIQICKSAPELVFLMMYRLNIMKDYEQAKNLKKRNLMIGFLLGLYWFFKGENERSYRPLLRTIWSLVSFATFEACWSTELLQRCNLMYDNYNVIDNYIFNKLNKDNRLYEEKKGEKRGEYKEEEKYLNTFRDQILYNNDLVLYAQRNYLNRMFKDNDIFSLEDNSVPYDFDHICPSSYRRKKIHKEIKELLDQIGNFRAWPYELNRSDQDNSIPQKFKFTSNKNLFNKYHINNEEKLKNFSMIEWKNITDYEEEELKGNKNNTIRSLCGDIKERGYLIYKTWYNLIMSIYDDIDKGLFYYNKYEQKNRNENIVKSINKEIKKFNKNSYVSYDEEYEDLIANDCIILYLSDNEITTEKDLEDASIDKEFKFTLPSYSKDSFKHLYNEIIQTITDYEEKSAKK